MTVTIWHNPRCSKSRDTLALIEAEGIDPTVRLYLKDPPSEGEIETALNELGLPAQDLIRTGEKLYRELGLTSDMEAAMLIKAMAANPILIERPIVFSTGRAVIGRPPRNVLDIL